MYNINNYIRFIRYSYKIKLLNNLNLLKSCILKFFIIIIGSFYLSSCGFRPVYNNYEKKELEDLYAIEIEPIATIAGTEFYEHLTNILPQKLPTKYILKVSFNYTTSPLAIQRNTDILIQTTHQLICYKLIDSFTSKVLISEKFQHMASHNSTFSPYASEVEKEGVIENLTRYSAEEIRNRLILYFNKNKV